MFLPDMLQAQQVLYVFGELGKKHLGRLWVHLEKEGIHHTMYVACRCMRDPCACTSHIRVTSVHTSYTLIILFVHTVVPFILFRYATEWLLTMYCRGFSFDLVTRVWDVFFSEGYKIVFRVALALVKVFYSIPSARSQRLPPFFFLSSNFWKPLNFCLYLPFFLPLSRLRRSCCSPPSKTSWAPFDLSRNWWMLSD